MDKFRGYRPEDVTIREAFPSDHDSILAITEDEDLWGGMDYLPFTLNNWLLEAEPPGSRRKNFVFTLGDHVVAFRSIFFQNDFKMAVSFAFRVVPQLRGQGFGKAMSALRDEYMRVSVADCLVVNVTELSMSA